MKSSIYHAEKNETLCKSIQVTLTKGTAIENLQAVYCEEDGEFTVYCNICDKFCIEIYHKNQLKSQTHTNNIYRREQLNK